MTQKLELPVKGMDCAECTLHVKKALSALPGVGSVEVYLAAEKAVVEYEPTQTGLAQMRHAVASAGYSVPEEQTGVAPAMPSQQALAASFTRQVLLFFGLVFGFVLFIVVVGEWLNLIETVTRRVPFPLGLAIVILSGFPVFRNVVRATLNRQIIAHTLMSMGVLAALAIGEWATAAVVVFFMRMGDYAERFTAERARRAVKDLAALAPQKARLERDGIEIEVRAEEVRPGEVVIVRPGELLPVDGQVISGQATVDQSAITGESMPVEAGPGTSVFAASIVRMGSLRIRTTGVGSETTFGRVIHLVEEAEAHRADVQRVADRFSGYYLPVVAVIAALTFLIRRDPLATAAVLVVACSCSFALATPIAMLASIGAGARRGLVIKGGKYLELLASADVLLIDKTGTLTLGQPRITDILSAQDGTAAAPLSERELLRLAASAERYSEHPLAEAVRQAARESGLELLEPTDFEAIPGMGIRARLNGSQVVIGSLRLAGNGSADIAAGEPLPELRQRGEALSRAGKTLLYVEKDGLLAGLLAASDTLRPEVPAALRALRKLGIRHIELLTGDNERAAALLAESLTAGGGPDEGQPLTVRANLLPEDKIAVVKEYQQRGHRVIMVGDGVNDAPALAQADVGIAMGAAGTDIAIEAAHIALMREDWMLVPQVVRIAKNTMRVVKTNIAFTAVYNIAGLSLAALGYLPPIFAAAAQSLPDLGILANSSRLLRQK
jgi:P-type Cu+ transporter